MKSRQRRWKLHSFLIIIFCLLSLHQFLYSQINIKERAEIKPGIVGKNKNIKTDFSTAPVVPVGMLKYFFHTMEAFDKTVLVISLHSRRDAAAPNLSMIISIADLTHMMVRIYMAAAVPSDMSYLLLQGHGS
jgi:hypothetical protein